MSRTHAQTDSKPTFMRIWELEEEEQGDSKLQKGISKQLKALIAVILLTRLGGHSFQHIDYVGHPAKNQLNFLRKEH